MIMIPASDTWSMGCILLQMVQYGSIESLKDRVRTRSWMKSSTIDTDLQDLINSMLKQNPKERQRPWDLQQHKFFK